MLSPFIYNIPMNINNFYMLVYYNGDLKTKHRNYND